MYIYILEYVYVHVQVYVYVNVYVYVYVCVHVLVITLLFIVFLSPVVLEWLPKLLNIACLKNYNKQSFIKDLGHVPWYVVFNNIENVDDCVDTWNKLFLDVAEAHVPTKTSRVRESSTTWMTSLIADQMRRRDYHQRKAKDNKNGRHWCVYRQLKNLVNPAIKKAK